MKNIPEKIYLQIDFGNYDEEDFNELTEITWCKDEINKNDISYVLESKNKELIVALEKFRDDNSCKYGNLTGYIFYGLTEIIKTARNER